MRGKSQVDKPSRDLIEIIHFTENVSAKIHGLLDEAEIFRVVKEEFAKTKRYTASILLLTDGGTKLKVVETSVPLERIRTGEKIARLRLKESRIDLKKSKIYYQVVKKGKTFQADVDEIISELFPRPLASIVSKTMGYEKKKAILTPLCRNGKIIGALAMTSPDLAECFIPSAKNLTRHISTALGLADEVAERKRAEERLQKAHDELEKRVEERTKELSKSNLLLKQEITERKKTEKALRESEEKFRNIFESANDCVVYLDRSGRILDVNKRAVEKCGGARKELIGKHFAKIGSLPPKEIQELISGFAKVLTGKRLTFDVCVKNKKGQEIFLECSASRVETGGRVVGLMFVGRDITARKQAEEKLKESEERFRALAQTATDAIVNVDSHGKIVFWNDAAENTFGYSAAEVIGQPLSLIVPKRFREARQNVLQRVVSTGKSKFIGKTAEFFGLRKDGSEFPMELSLANWKTREGLFFTGIIRDITERKRAEQKLKESKEQLKKYSESLEDTVQKRTERLSRLVESQKEFITDVSHELRTPLSVIKAVVEAELCKNKTSTAEQFSLVNKKVDQMTRILENLMLLSRLDVGQEGIRKITFDVRNFLDEVWKDVVREARREGINPEIKIRCLPGISFRADQTKISVVMTNLLRNAIFHSNGKAQIYLKVKKLGDNIQFIVEDNNQPILKGDLKKIFEKFYRTKQARSKNIGLGLGLYISQRLVKLMGGKIWAESQKGIGNRFIVELPLSSSV